MILNDALVLHIRLTSACNADCSYCSSYEDGSTPPLSLDSFQQSLGFIKRLIVEKSLGGSRKNLTVQYVGGEILTLDPFYLESCVRMTRSTLGDLFSSFQDGVQTNLIGSSRKIEHLIRLFGADKIGTSVDSFGEQRTVQGSASKYRTIFLKNQNVFKQQFGVSPPAILVVDQSSVSHLLDEYHKAESQKYNLTLRPVFYGGKDVQHLRAALPDLVSAYESLFDSWALKGRVMVQPFYQLLASRIGETIVSPSPYGDLYTFNTGCPFQNDCALHSLNLESDGELYLCLDMADSKQFSLGNAVTGIFHHEVWDRLRSRSEHLEHSCRTCNYRQSCQGGCMSEAIHHTGNPFGKTEYCGLWKIIFGKCDALIDTHGTEVVGRWLRFLNQKQRICFESGKTIF